MRQQQLKANSVLAPKFGFSYRSDILAPAKYLFNALAHPLADVITAMSGSACIDGRASVGVILCHMRGRPELAKFRNKAFGVVKLVATDRISTGVRPAYQRRCPAPPCRWPRSDHHPPPAHGGSPSAHDPYSRIGPPCHDLCDTPGLRISARFKRIVLALRPWKSRSGLRPPPSAGHPSHLLHAHSSAMPRPRSRCRPP